ncbi:MAG: TonB-dependent receptor, partial [Novosphingobium sp.]
MTGYGSRATALKAGASIAVLGALMLSAMPAYAQDAAGDDEAEVSDVIVTGTRAALRSAQNIKRDADTVVDSITATDIGAFPDKSVAEALQRVAGITVNRFAASSDTAHFSAEPSGVIVRGLQQVRTEFNGRDSFSANSGRGLSF